VRELMHPGIQVIYTTATCTAGILDQLMTYCGYRTGDILFRNTVDRPNLQIQVNWPYRHQTKKELRRRMALDVLRAVKSGGKAIIFVLFKRHAEILMNFMKELMSKDNIG